MATVFDNPYIKQLGLLPMEQTPPPQPLEGILGQRGLVGFGLNMLANPNENFGQQFAQGLAGGINAVDAYNQQLNKNAQQAAEYNLKVGQLAANYDLTDRELDIKEQAASAGAPLQQLLMAQMFGIKPTMPTTMPTTEPILPPEPMVEPDTGILPMPQEPIVSGGLLGDMVPSGEVGFKEDVQGGYIDTPANPMLVPPVNADAQNAKDIIKLGIVGGSAPIISGGKALLESADTAITEQKVEQDKLASQGKVDNIIGSVMGAIGKLGKQGALRNPEGGILDNMGNYLASTDTGQEFGKMTASQEQEQRDFINAQKPLLKIELIKAAGSVKAFDSNTEGKSLLDALGSPTLSAETNARIAENLSSMFGTGKLKAPDLLKQVQAEMKGGKSVKTAVTPSQDAIQAELKRRGLK